MAIQTYVDGGTTTANWGKINWTVNLGDNTGAGPRDQFSVDNSANTDAGYTTRLGCGSGVDLSGDGDLDVVLAGIETSQDFVGRRQDLPRCRGNGQHQQFTATGAAYPERDHD